MIYQGKTIEITPIFNFINIQTENSIIIQPMNIFVEYKDEQYVFNFKIVSLNNNYETLILQSVQQPNKELKPIQNIVFEIKKDEKVYDLMSNIMNRYLLDK